MKYEYLFDCADCTNKVIVDGVTYCIPLRQFENPIIATDDYKLKCLKYKPGQITLFEGREDDGTVNEHPGHPEGVQGSER